MLGLYLIFITTASSSDNEKCSVSKYRNADGRCNNVHRPNWGRRNSPFLQLPLEIQGKTTSRLKVTYENLNLYSMYMIYNF